MQPPGIFVSYSSMWLGFGLQHGLEGTVGILLLWDHKVCKRSCWHWTGELARSAVESRGWRLRNRSLNSNKGYWKEVIFQWKKEHHSLSFCIILGWARTLGPRPGTLFCHSSERNLKYSWTYNPKQIKLLSCYWNLQIKTNLDSCFCCFPWCLPPPFPPNKQANDPFLFSDHSGELLLPWGYVDWHRLTHPQRRWLGGNLHRSGWSWCCRCHGRNPLGAQMPKGRSKRNTNPLCGRWDLRYIRNIC